MYSIGEFSRITGLSVKTLRFYHEKGIPGATVHRRRNGAPKPRRTDRRERLRRGSSARDAFLAEPDQAQRLRDASSVT
ncbi:MAG: MerR family DNA-binding transcriptional regulator [Planctomycetes bacterium]|nr:MerR family DNA-binding transcriptional regulator [Planctomycetota bacterium]MBL7038643.1 MerR family DNA-binding transcriptional regulator [Pirellulaceae bacterium]